ncbi:hypothetical protein [Amycolatopsis coloradensis]|uniref:hypothetical protein n=1 Tax=Amycolatopsis coloradensis TaxID=76021 RepID=UPI001177355D|nr:hypothetical protein [Amycolatopsis coloradensis]
MLLSPATIATSEAIPLVAEALGLVAVADLPGSPPAVAEHLTRLVLVGDVAHVLYGGSGDLYRPVGSEWVAAAVEQGFIMVTCGMDPWTGDDFDQLDRYLAEEHRLFIGRVRLHVESTGAG